MKGFRTLYSPVLLLVALSLPAFALAQQCTAPASTCGSSTTATQASPNGPTGAGNPIDVTSGNKYQHDVDLEWKGDLALTYSRHYNSLSRESRELGPGWSNDFDTRLTRIRKRNAAGSTNYSIDVRQADGRVVHFEPAGADVDGVRRYRSVPAGYGVITERVELAEKLLRAADKPVAAGAEDPAALRPWEWRWLEGRRLTFDGRGLVGRIENPDGDFLELTYDHARRLVRVRDALARTASLEYWDDAQERLTRFESNKAKPGSDAPEGVAGMLKSLTGPDGTRLRYGYDADGMLAGVWYDDGTVRRYEYSLSAGARRLARIIGRDRKLVGEYGYDEYGRAVSTSGPGGEGRVDLKYILPRKPGEPGATWLRNAVGDVSVFRWTYLPGDSGARLVEAVGSGCEQCPPVNLRYGYDEHGRISTVEKLSPADPTKVRSGRVIARFSTDYDDLGRITELRRDVARGKPGNLIERREYEGDFGKPVRVARPSVVAGREHVLETEFNELGQPLRIQESGFDPRDSAAITRATTFSYSVIGGRSRLASVDGPLPNGPTSNPSDSDVTLYQYDATGARVVRITQPMNLVTNLVHDNLGRLIAVTSPTGLTDSYRYGRGQELEAVMQSASVGVGYKYDLQGRIVETSRILGEKRQPQVRFDYDSHGRLVAEADANGALKTAAYDLEGRLIESVVGRGNVRQLERYGYDAFGRLEAVADNTGAVHRVAYDDANRVSGIVDPNDRLTVFAYSPEGRISTAIRAANTDAAVGVSYAFNGAGGIQRVSVQHNDASIAESAHSTDVLRDDFGREVKVASPDSGLGVRRFDAADRLVYMADAAGHAEYRYDAAGRIVYQALSATVGESEVTRWQYRGARLAAVLHPNQSEHYEYDEEGRVSARSVEIAAAAKGGESVEIMTRYEYDAAGTLTSMTLPDGSNLELVRNGLDQVVAIKRHRINARWLRWLLDEQTIVSEVDSDIIGLRHYLAGNGVEAWLLRSQDGVLSRTIYRSRNSSSDNRDTQVAASERLLLGALGISDARAAATTESQKFATLLDRRYSWDLAGNLRKVEETTGAAISTREYFYDAHDRLAIANRKLSGPAFMANGADGANGGTSRTDRFYFNPLGNRVLEQLGAKSVDDFTAPSRELRFERGSNRVAGAVDMRVEFDAAGRPRSSGSRQFEWDPAGRLVSIRDRGAGKTLASYRYNHRGERIAKTVSGHTTLYLYEQHRLSAELDAQGRLTRQYIYLGDLPIAILDTPSGAKAADAGVGHDIATAFRHWFSDAESIVYLHTNHLGAPELGTDGEGNVIWRADYDSFGRARAAGALEVNLRAPGQYADDESGLHYNDQRYYDPESGRYLSPDPLGLAGGLNVYAYADGNPQKFVDPTGLILIAFDGTGNNSNPNSPLRDFTNIWWMHQFYDLDAPDQQWRSYERGVGTNPDSWGWVNDIEQGRGSEGHDLINNQLRRLDAYLSSLEDPRARVVLDVIGFSRGAAEARDFANQVINRYHDRYYGAHCIVFRFLGLFETVSQFGLDGADDDEYDFHIAPEWQAVSQAYALNEHRRLFPLRHIERGNEQGFIGAHSDIGGGYNIVSEATPGDLSDVALNWMIDQARAAGVVFRELPEELRTVSNPVLHDQRNTSVFYGKRYSQPVYDAESGEQIGTIGPDERGVFMDSGSTRRIPQPQFAYSDPRWGPMLEGLIQRPANWEHRTDNCAGQVDMLNYRIWLLQHYNLHILPSAREGRTQPCVRML